MLTKNNLKHIFVLALGFFICSSIYLTESTILSSYTNVDYSNRISVLYANLSMTLGILIFSVVYRKSKNIKKYYILSMLLSIISLVVFFITKNTKYMSICLCLNCLLGTSGFCLGYHFTLIALNIEKDYRARVFSIGYSIGSVLSYIVMVLPNYIYESFFSLFIYIGLIIINVILVYRLNNLEVVKKDEYTSSFKRYFILLSLIVIIMSFLSVISTDTIAIYSFNMKELYRYSRIYYAIGLIVAGILCDKNKELFEILTLSSFVFYLISIVLLIQNISPSIIVALSYFFLGFFVVFRTISFINLGSKSKSVLFICAYGPMYHIFIESFLAIFKNTLNHYLILIIFESINLVLLLIIYILFYLKKNRISENEKLKEISLKYKLSIQEEKVLMLLTQDLTNQEMADRLYVSINTIRNHVANIYKKTGMKKKELREKLYYGTN